MQTAQQLPPVSGTPTLISQRFGIPLPRVSGGTVRILESRYEEAVSLPVSGAESPISDIQMFDPFHVRIQRFFTTMFKRNPK